MPQSPTANFDTVNLHGQFIGFDGAPIGGTVSFTPRANRMVDLGARTTIIGRPRVVTLDNSGSFSVDLPATDDPDINVSFTYQVTENFAGGEIYDIQVPIAAKAAGIDLVDVPRTYEVNTMSGSFLVGSATGMKIDYGPTLPATGTVGQYFIVTPL